MTYNSTWALYVQKPSIVNLTDSRQVDIQLLSQLKVSSSKREDINLMLNKTAQY